LLRASRDRGQYHLLSPQRGRALREMVGDAQGNCAASERAPPQLPAPKMAPMIISGVPLQSLLRG
jgi:hypothetical protein